MSLTLFILCLILTGCAVGLISTILGVGGGILIIPILYLLFPDTHPTFVLSNSLIIIFLNSIFNTLTFHKNKKHFDSSMILPIGISAAISILLSVQLTWILDPILTKRIFSISLFLIFLKMLHNINSLEIQKNKKTDIQSVSKASFILTGCTTGIFSGITGLGGGAILIPTLINYLKVPHHQISPTSNGVMIFTTFSGVCYHFIKSLQPENASIIKHIYNATSSYTPNLLYAQTSTINWFVVGPILIGTFITRSFGVKLLQVISKKKIHLIFCLLVLFFAIRIFIKSWT